MSKKITEDISAMEFDTYMSNVAMEVCRKILSEGSQDEPSLLVENAYKKLVAEKVGAMSKSLQFAFDFAMILIEQDMPFIQAQGNALEAVIDSPWGKKWMKDMGYDDPKTALNKVAVAFTMDGTFKDLRAMFDKLPGESKTRNVKDVEPSVHADFEAKIRRIIIDRLDAIRKEEKNAE